MLQQRTQRRCKVPFSSRLTLSLMCLAQRVRRLKTPAVLFRRPLVTTLRISGWSPRSWKERRSLISRWFLSQTLRIHRGRRWRRLFIQRWVAGFAFGNFARTQTVAVFKKKASAKKRKRLQQNTQAHVFDWRIQRIKDVRAGLKRKTCLHIDASFEQQLRSL